MAISERLATRIFLIGTYAPLHKSSPIPLFSRIVHLRKGRVRMRRSRRVSAAELELPQPLFDCLLPSNQGAFPMKRLLVVIGLLILAILSRTEIGQTLFGRNSDHGNYFRLKVKVAYK